jgi:hypothetical protein
VMTCAARSCAAASAERCVKRIPFVCDSTGRELVEADEYTGPDVLYVWSMPHPLFGPRRRRRAPKADRAPRREGAR